MLKTDVKKYYGSFAKAARALGISSAKMAVDIEQATNGAVTRFDLRDDALEIWNTNS